MVTRILLACLFTLPALAQFSVPSSAPMAAALLKPAAGGGGGDYLTGIILNLDVDSLSGSDGDNLTTWPDTSGNSYDFSQGASVSRAKFTNSTAIFGGAKSLHFDGVDFYTNRVFALTAQNYTYIGVFQFDAQANSFATGCLLGSSTDSLMIKPEDASVHKLTVIDGSTRQFAFLGANPPIPIVLSIVMNSTGTALRVYTNGVEMASATAFTQPSGGFLSIGAQYDSGGGMVGVLGDQRLYAGALSDANRKIVEGVMGTKFGITVAP
jgi:hypothetical protein